MRKPAEVELDNYWRALALLRQSRAGETVDTEARDEALSEIEAIRLHTESAALRTRCLAVLNAETTICAKVAP